MDEREYGPGTPQYNDKKWAPLTRGLTSREAVYTAHVLEQEARFLARQVDTEDTDGGSLKYVFPTIRAAVPRLLDGDLDFQRVHATLSSALGAVCQAEAEQAGTILYVGPTRAETDEETRDLAGRVKTAIEGLRDVL